VRRTLVTALASCAGQKARIRLHRFLSGLSSDELEFLAGFQGARILERCCGVSSGNCLDPGPAASRPNYYGLPGERCAADRIHKMIVLREYLARCGYMPTVL